MKKLVNSKLFYFILGAIIFGSITSVLAYSFGANSVEYIPLDQNWKKQDGTSISNVKDAIDELHLVINKFGTFTSVAGNNTISIGFVPEKLIITRDGFPITFVYQRSFATNKFLGFATTGNIEYANMNGKIDFVVNVSSKTISTSEPTKWSNYFVSVGSETVFYTKNAGEIWHWAAID